MTTKGQLDALTAGGCTTPGCDCGREGVLYFHGRCHPGGHIEVSYRHGSGVLRVGCRECGKVIAQIAVAQEPTP